MINEICPKKEVINAIVKDVVVPILKQLEPDIGMLNYKCSVYIGNKEEFYTIINSSGEPISTDVYQAIRIRFRTIFQPNKLKFHVEAVLTKEFSPKDTGFSGFDTNGSINIDDLSMKNSAWIVRYNVWDWRGWKF